MAKRENVLEKLIGKTTRPEGELEAIDRRLHENTARCFDGVLSLCSTTPANIPKHSWAADVAA